VQLRVLVVVVVVVGTMVGTDVLSVMLPPAMRPEFPELLPLFAPIEYEPEPITPFPPIVVTLAAGA